MRFFALVIPYSLISLTYAQWEFSLPHPPELDLRSTILDRRDPEDLIPADQTSPLDSSWLLSETDLNPTDGSSTDWLLNSDTTKEPNASDLFLETSYLDDLESDLFAGGDLGCNSDTINDLQLFNKQRRGVSCSNPAMRESQPPKGSTQGGNSDENNEANGVSLAQLFNPLSLFPEDSGLCPPKIFGLSVIPLCAVFVPGTYVLIPGARYVTLLDVYPRKLSIWRSRKERAT